MVKRSLKYRVVIDKEVELDDDDDVELEKQKIREAEGIPDLRVTVCVELAEDEAIPFLKATAPPGSVPREDIKERFGIDLD